jgi:hypothetical protein
MNITVKRIKRTEKSTIGELSIDGIFECYTLEDCEREVKIKNITAIPKGTYEVIINHSNHFNKELPLLIAIPNYAGVRIHCGNRPEDTEGCILVGESRGLDFISNSRSAFGKLFEKMKESTSPITITIE